MPTATPAPKPYLYAEELAAVTPWSVEAIRKKVQRGELRHGLHYFQDQQRRRLIFKWAAIVELIESDAAKVARSAAPGHDRKVIAIEEATERLRRLHG